MSPHTNPLLSRTTSRTALAATRAKRALAPLGALRPAQAAPRLALRSSAWVALALLVACASGCKTATKDSASAGSTRSDDALGTAKAAAKTATAHPAAPKGHSAGSAAAGGRAPTTRGGPDPEGGDFSLEEATAGLGGTGSGLKAKLETDQGTLECELWPDKAPTTVANFVGLARGTRPWLKAGAWVKEPLYDGTPFHRIIKGFMIQGGDPLGTGQGGPGYVIKDEVWPGAHHRERGLLCMANRGPNTNGSQFFIMDGSAPHLDGGYTVFGKCGPDAVVEKLASTPLDPHSRQPVKAPVMKRVTVSRG